MKPNIERVEVIWGFFGKRVRGRLRDEFLASYGYHVQTFYNKLNPKYPNSFFSGDEMVWIEKWARDNGMPESLLNNSNSKAQPA